jgi:uncharacterized membrane protein YhhN
MRTSLRRYLVLLVPTVLLIVYLLFPYYALRLCITLSCLLVAVGVSLRSKRSSVMIVALAFLFSIGGDAMMVTSSSANLHFLYGVALFFVAHLCYITFCLRHGGVNRPWLFVLTALFLVYYCAALLPAITGMVIRIAVLLYILVSCMSLAAARGLACGKLFRTLFLTGIACLAISDTLISAHSFLNVDILYFLMLPLYFASQIFVCAALLSSSQQEGEGA